MVVVTVSEVCSLLFLFQQCCAFMINLLPCLVFAHVQYSFYMCIYHCELSDDIKSVSFYSSIKHSAAAEYRALNQMQIHRYIQADDH